MLGSNNTLYFSEGTNIRQLPNAPTAAMLIPTTPVVGISFVNHMAIDGNNLYVKTGQSVVRYDVTTFGGSVTQATLGSDALQNTPSNLLDGSFLYYVKNTGNNIIKVAK